MKTKPNIVCAQASGQESETSGANAGTQGTETQLDCAQVWSHCLRNNVFHASCYEDSISNCYVRSRATPGFIYRRVNTSDEAVESPTAVHQVHIPSSALQRSRVAASEEEVVLVVTVLDSAYFKLRQRPAKGRLIVPDTLPTTVLDGTVLVVRAGRRPVQNLPQPVRLTFRHNQQVQNGTCVYWIEAHGGEGRQRLATPTSDIVNLIVRARALGYWSTDGCNTSDTGSKFVCSCNHLSFFAVLVNPAVSVSKRDAVNLSYITCVGSSLSVVFTVVTLVIYACLQKRRPEKAIGIHMNLTVSLLCLHLSFLLSSFWAWQDEEDGWLCRAFGLILHWSLIATITWSALEGFHLYLLLVRVFNIYVRRYLLKLSVVGWGFSTLIAVVCGSAGAYGRYVIQYNDSNDRNSSTKICMMSSQFPHSSLVIYVTAVVYPCLVILCNSCMLGVVVYKMFGQRRSPSVWREGNKDNWRRLLKGCATVLGLSCVVGLPWGLTAVTFISTTGIYVFTVLNSLQGVFVFLWCVAMTCKASTDDSSTVKGSSSQKMMTTSFNN
ncbi:adhesion G protein-coupled receptor G3 [Neosynchiropus ocellatus]